MSNGLDYFKQVYGQVPSWVQKMHDYSPDVLDKYTGIRGEIMQDGALSRKEKDVIIASMNAARLYARSMVYHTKGAMDFGCELPELVEYFLVAYLYRGDQALTMSLEAITYACELKGKEVSRPATIPVTAKEALEVIIGWIEEEETGYLKEVYNLLDTRDRERLETKILEEGHVTPRLKYLNMAGNYITELRGREAAPWMEKARAAGATEADLADVGYICILTAGIPTWFELSDSLKLADEIC